MTRSFIRLTLACVAGGIVGFLVGSGIGIACTAGPCPMFNPAFQLTGATLGAGVAALSVLMARPDPRACNRQDPPMSSDG